MMPLVIALACFIGMLIALVVFVVCVEAMDHEEG